MQTWSGKNILNLTIIVWNLPFWFKSNWRMLKILKSSETIFRPLVLPILASKKLTRENVRQVIAKKNIWMIKTLCWTKTQAISLKPRNTCGPANNVNVSYWATYVRIILFLAWGHTVFLWRGVLLWRMPHKVRKPLKSHFSQCIKYFSSPFYA